MKKTYWILILVSVIFSACENDTGEKKIEEIKTDGSISNSDIIRNPISIDSPDDTVNVAKLVFDETEFDFGTIQQGDIVKHTFTFTNTGKIPLLISNARSSCGCTVPDWPKEYIEPGKQGKIYVEFDSKNRKNRQDKQVTVTANTFPSSTKIKLIGFIEENKE